MLRASVVHLLLAVVVVAGYRPPAVPSRRVVLATTVPALLAVRRPADALERELPEGGSKLLSLRLPSLPGSVLSGRPRVELVNTPNVCQGRCREQDFVVVRYVGRRANGGPVFDNRYAQQPLVFELGSFYLPGVDAALEGACAGSIFRFTWSGSPSLGAEAEAVLPAGTPIELELELLTIKYSLFGEKMRNATNAYWFAPEPLTLTSAADPRGHSSARAPVVTKDNPFSIAPGEKNIISNPSSMLGPLFKDFF